MDQLKEDVDKATKNINGETNGDISNGETKPQINGDHTAGDKATPSLPCPVTNNFEFEVLHAIRCKDCGEVVTKTEEFYDLSVDMPRIR